MQEELRYIIISPVRDEAQYIEKTIKCVASQTIKPFRWIIVNDGSTDNTGQIIDLYAKQYPWIKIIHRANRGFRKAGGGVMEAFYEGYSSLESKDFDYIVKLDGDLSFETDYFEKCFIEFGKNPELGIGGGVVGHILNGKFKIEENPLFHVRGATKIYRRECWDDIGELIIAPGWDTLDEVKANMKGWKTQSFYFLTLNHHRITGGADGAWRNLVKNGMANYISGYHPLFMYFKCIKRIFQKPYIVGSIALLYGFLSGYLKKIPQVDDPSLIQYLRNQQFRKLTLRKSIWN